MYPPIIKNTTTVRESNKEIRAGIIRSSYLTGQQRKYIDGLITSSKQVEKGSNTIHTAGMAPVGVVKPKSQAGKTKERLGAVPIGGAKKGSFMY